jgi:hypothetical protein
MGNPGSRLVHSVGLVRFPPGGVVVWATWSARYRVSACSFTGGGALRVFGVARAASGGWGSSDPLTSPVPGYREWWCCRRARFKTVASLGCGFKVGICGVGLRSGAVRARGPPPADGGSSSSLPAPRRWILLRLVNAFGLGALLLLWRSCWVAASFVVSGGAGFVPQLISRLKLVCAFVVVLCFFACFVQCTCSIFVLLTR